jgi:hypothetical protein
MMTLDETISLYQRPPLSGVAGEQMVRFLVSCRDLLGTGALFFGTGHSTLWVTKDPHYEQHVENPSIRIYSDGTIFEFVYQESWQDDSLRRMRAEHIRCELEHTRTALTELLHRLR